MRRSGDNKRDHRRLCFRTNPLNEISQPPSFHHKEIKNIISKVYIPARHFLWWHPRRIALIRNSDLQPGASDRLSKPWMKRWSIKSVVLNSWRAIPSCSLWPLCAAGSWEPQAGQEPESRLLHPSGLHHVAPIPHTGPDRRRTAAGQQSPVQFLPEEHSVPGPYNLTDGPFQARHVERDRQTPETLGFWSQKCCIVCNCSFKMTDFVFRRETTFNIAHDCNNFFTGKQLVFLCCL